MTHDDFLELMALTEKLYLCERYMMICGWMLLGVGFLLAYQVGRKGSK